MTVGVSQGKARIVITGAPASGKSDFLKLLQQREAFSGFVFFEELARLLLTERPNFRLDRRAFHREIYARQVAREDAVPGQSFITDRGTLDAFAFHPDTATEVGTTIEKEYRRYTAVVQLGSAASLGAATYEADPIRTESREDAMAIEESIKNVWQGHGNYTFVAARHKLEEKLDEFIAVMEMLRPAKC